MPPKRQYRKRRTYPKRRTPARAAYTALRMVKQIKKSEEVKKVSLTYLHSPVMVTNSGVVYPVTAISQNDTAFGRIGNEIVIKNILIQGQIARGVTATAPSATFRLVMFYDRQEVASLTPSLTEIFEPASMGTALAPYAMLNRINVGRFQIVKSVRMIVDTNTPVKQFKFNVNFKKPFKTRFSAGSNSSNIRGTLWFAVITDVDTVIPTLPTVIGNIHCSFIDD